MSKKIFAVILGLIFVSLLCGRATAATIHLKNGSKISGEIVEQKPDFVKVDISGVTITYYRDEIRRIEGADAPSPAPAAGGEKPASRPAAGRPEAAPPSPPSGGSMDISSGQKRRLILKYLEISGTKETLDRMFKQMISEAPEDQSAQLRQIYDLEEIIDVLVPVYDQHFTAAELNELVRFYQSDVARKLSEVGPQVMEDALDAAVRYFQAKLPMSPTGSGQ